MKITEKKYSYTVREHGNEYVEPQKPVHLCPECYSDKTRVNTPKYDNVYDKLGDYICDNCGCTFNVHADTYYTTFGYIMKHIMDFLFLIFCICSVLLFFVGVVYGCDHCNEDGSFELRELVISLILTFIAPAVVGFLAYTVHKVKRAYFERG